jgi:hypothetical protein
MNSNSPFSLFENVSFDNAIQASARASARLNNALSRMLTVKKKLEDVKKVIGASNHLIKKSKEVAEKQNDIINKCIARLNTLHIAAKDNDIIRKHLNGNHHHNGNLPAAEKESLHAALESVNHEISKPAAVIAHQCLEIDLKTPAETSFWCKKLNASRPEILQAMEQIKSKSWVKVWKYFLNKNKSAVVAPVKRNPSSIKVEI